MTREPAGRPEPLAIAITSSLVATEVVVAGELDMSNASELEVALAGIALMRFATIRLDLGGLTFCDTRGARVLVGFIGSARQHGLAVRTHGASPMLKKEVRLLGGPSLDTHAA